MSYRWWVLLFCAVLITGCDSDLHSNGRDAGQDAGRDAEVDSEDSAVGLPDGANREDCFFEGGEWFCPLPREEACDDGVDGEDNDGLIDCADEDDCVCGVAAFAWSVELNQVSTTCARAGADRVEITMSDMDSGTEHTFGAPCADMMTASIEVFLGGNYTAQVRLLAAPINGQPGAPIATTVLDRVFVSSGLTLTNDVVLNVVQSVCSPVAIQRVYTEGGTHPAGFDHDFVELHNRTAAPIPIDGWSLLLGPEIDTWSVVPLTGTIAGGGFWLVQLGGGTTDGSDLVAADTTGTHDLDTFDSVVLRSTAEPFVDFMCPTTDVIDVFGGTFCRSEGSPSGVPEASEAHERMSCVDTNDNYFDFSVQLIDEPRNSSTTPVLCPACAM